MRKTRPMDAIPDVVTTAASRLSQQVLDFAPRETRKPEQADLLAKVTT
jgi:hypothetical protein